MSCRLLALPCRTLLFIAMLCCGLPMPSFAGSFKVSPVRVDLTAANPTAAIVVQNESDAESVVVQMQAKRWTQQNGEDVFAPSPEFIATPPIFTLKPRASQIVRVGLRKAEHGDTQATYRLYLTEVPGAPAAGFRGLRVALNIGIPIFIAPKAATGGKPEWRAELAPGGTLVLSVANPANSHVQILDVSVFDESGGQPIASVRKPRYVLARQTLRWELPLSHAPKGKLRVVARTGAGDLDEDLPVVAGAGKS